MSGAMPEVSASRDSADVAVSDNAFVNNRGYSGGGVHLAGDTQERITLRQNVFRSNYTTYAEGGGIFVEVRGPATLLNVVNNVLSKNYTAGGHGGGAHRVHQGITNVINNTFVGNATPIGNGGGLTVYHAAGAYLYNNVFWNNTAVDGRDVSFYDVITPADLYANDLDLTAGGILWWSSTPPASIDPSNLNKVDPLFVDLGNEDYHLQPGSPCIDTGNNLAPQLPTTDMDGQPRIVNGIVDMGAYEHQGALEIAIDIRPRRPVNLIVRQSPLSVPVAILSSPTFDAPAR